MIKILRFVKDPSGALVGFVDCLSGWKPNDESAAYLHNDVMIFEKNNKRWIKITDSSKRTGQKNDKGYHILRPSGGYIDKKTQSSFSDAVIAALDLWLKNGGVPEIAPPKEQRQQAAPAYAAGSNNDQEDDIPF